MPGNTRFDEPVRTALPAQIVSRASLWRPDFVVESTWLEYVPFAFWLFDALRPATLVGFCGADWTLYASWCQAAARLDVPTRCHAFAVAGSEGQAAFRSWHDARYAEFSTLNEMSGEALAQAEGVPGSVDLLYIGDGYADGTDDDEFERWVFKLSRGGVVVMAGISTQARQHLWRRLSARYPSFSFDRGQGLGVLAMGPQVPAAIHTLCEARGETVDVIREIYARLGQTAAIQEAEERGQSFAQIGAVPAERVDNGNHVDVRRQLAEVMASLRDAEAELAAQQDQIAELVRDLQEENDATNSLTSQLEHVVHERERLLNSTSWRMTAPLRGVVISLRSPGTVTATAQHALAVVKRSVQMYGWKETLRKIAAAPGRYGLRRLLGGQVSAPSSPRGARRLPAPRAALDELTLRVLIVAEMSIPQCLKYRVTQKQQMIRQLGFDCTVINWTDIRNSHHLLQTHSVAIFYRVPGYPEPLELIREAKEMGIPTFWEVDDLIFDPEKYQQNSNLDDLPADTRRSLLAGVVLYRKAMLACDFAIASTPGLKQAMLEAGVPRAFVIENALDRETVRLASDINRTKRGRDGLVRIVYGSGTKTHDADFREAGAAIKAVLRERPQVRLVVLGELTLPADYAEVSAQIERLPSSNYSTYLKRVARCDINIAPLEQSIFNDAKSNIKYIEASIVRLPSICSPSAAFRTAIRHGDTGFLVESTEQWYRALLDLVDHPELREAMAERAYRHVVKDYAPRAVAKNQVAPLLNEYRQERHKLRVLAVNIFFEPRSFGGATIVAEEIARCLNAGDEVDYTVFTSLPVSDAPAYKLVRYASNGTGVLGMGLPYEADPMFEFENPHTVAAFREAVRAIRPDVVHLHSLQGMGAQIVEVCASENIPFVVTLHDAWWICGRQFMITGENRYCNQRKIDVNVCATCVHNAELNNYRQFRLREFLQNAALLIAPSEFFKGLFVDNGFDASRIVVNKNGVLPPKRHISRTSVSGRPLRFGYVGGETPIKGAPLIKKAFRSLADKNYELHVVDNMLNLGDRSIHPGKWKIPGTLKIVPAYTQNNIDEFFANIDVLLFPTQWKESFGLTVREALIRDVWVVATDGGGVVEDIVVGENGDIVPLDDDGTELARVIERLLKNPEALDGYRNPYAEEIRTFGKQALELENILSSVTTHLHYKVI